MRTQCTLHAQNQKHREEAGVVWTDLLLHILQADAKMAKKEFHLTRKRSGSNGRMTRG